MKAVLSAIFCLFLMVTDASAQGNVEMADTLRSSGMIYVVVAVIVLIFLGIVLFLFSLDRRIKKIEQTNH
jgi:hypothetical protein